MGLLRRKILARVPLADRARARQAYKTATKTSGTTGVLAFLALFVCVHTYHTYIAPLTSEPQGLAARGGDVTFSAATHASRLLASHNGSNVTNTKPTHDSDDNNDGPVVIGPPNWPNYWIDPYKNGGAVVYIIGMIYTFMGLAVVCDEFFVPALEVMIEKFDISEDVAGATLMAVSGMHESAALPPPHRFPSPFVCLLLFLISLLSRAHTY